MGKLLGVRLNQLPSSAVKALQLFLPKKVPQRTEKTREHQCSQCSHNGSHKF